MIISASRRTEIPAFFSDWMLNRLKAGFCMVRNPYNRKVSEIPLTKDNIDCIVFWTKNPEPMLPRLTELEVPYFFHYTITGYGRELEPTVPSFRKSILMFKDLHNKGNGHVIWRYDPIIFAGKYTVDWHLKTFEAIAGELCGYTDRCVISFFDMYPHLRDNMSGFAFHTVNDVELIQFCEKLVKIAAGYGMTVSSCAEEVDLDACGIRHNRCIDPDYITSITGIPLNIGKDKGQRAECGCAGSVDIGKYNTCRHNCRYCYARRGASVPCPYDPDSPILCDMIREGETYTRREFKDIKETQAENPQQLRLFDESDG